MHAPPIARPTSQLPLTRNHLYALGALSLALAVLSFFLGLQLGKTGTPPTAAPPVASLVPPEVRSGDLEVLLANVERARAGDTRLTFPEELSKTDAPPTAPLVDAGAAAAALPPDAAAAVPAVVAPPLPADARDGTAEVGGPPAVAPQVDGDVPTAGWSLQVGEHASEADAARTVDTLRAAGLPAYRVVALVDGAPAWRVRIGGYESKAAATAAVSEISSRAGVATAVVTPAP